MLDVNLRAAFLASRAVYPHMKEQGGGKIVNIGSMFSIFGGGGSGAPYSASKGGIVQLSKSLAVAWAKDNIQSNAILPGWFMTDLTAAVPTNATGAVRPDQPPHPLWPLGRAGRTARGGDLPVQRGVGLRYRRGDYC